MGGDYKRQSNRYFIVYKSIIFIYLSIILIGGIELESTKRVPCSSGYSISKTGHVIHYTILYITITN